MKQDLILDHMEFWKEYNRSFFDLKAFTLTVADI